MNEDFGIVDVDHATGGPGVQSVPVDALVLGLEVVRGRSLVVLPVQRLHCPIGPAHDELADRVHAVVWEKWRTVNPSKNFQGLLRFNQDLPACVFAGTAVGSL